ncbi:DUF2267 domain-containing protein [Halegenticoccus soli]|uniref:DUF2267 domain-containing protein n=1 Tax=Halegenticoccus soli TaxID=1985678 RepID=UPI000C6DC5F4|nr:DUF2267 domain-containing protein [Halegenticoccus soli]
MDYDAFIGEVQNRAQLSSREDAVRATRITLETLSRRIKPGAAENLAAQLPEKIGRHLSKVGTVETFEWNEFVGRVVEKRDYNPEDERGDAVHHSRAVMDVVAEAVTVGVIEELRDQISSADDWNELFVLVDQDEKPSTRSNARGRPNGCPVASTGPPLSGLVPRQAAR